MFRPRASLTNPNIPSRQLAKIMSNELTYLQEKTMMVLMSPLGALSTGASIARRIGLKERSGKTGADMRSIIHALRVKGYPICAKGEGYYLAQSSDELSKYICEFQGRIDKQQEALEGLKKAFDGAGGVRLLRVQVLTVEGHEVGRKVVDNKGII